MPVKRKKSSSKKRSRKSSRSEPISALLIDPIVPEVIPPPPLPFETLVGLLTENPMTDKDIDGIRVSSYIAKKLTAQEIRDLHFAFDIFDNNKDGYINEDEFMQALKCLGMPCSADYAKRVFARAAKMSLRDQAVRDESSTDAAILESESADSSHFKGLNVCQFLEVVISRQGDSYDYMDELTMAFQYFDIADTGKITAESLNDVARSVGFELSKKSCQEMVAYADKDGDNAVNISEFIRLMLDTNLYSSHLLGSGG